MDIDIVDFAEEYLGIKLFDYQKEMLRKMNVSECSRYRLKDGRIDTNALVWCLNAIYKTNQ